jgi:hypothetical protein
VNKVTGQAAESGINALQPNPLSVPRTTGRVVSTSRRRDRRAEVIAARKAMRNDRG